MRAIYLILRSPKGIACPECSEGKNLAGIDPLLNLFFWKKKLCM
jgi:hypothetical protein